MLIFDPKEPFLFFSQTAFSTQLGSVFLLILLLYICVSRLKFCEGLKTIFYTQSTVHIWLGKILQIDEVLKWWLVKRPKVCQKRSGLKQL